MSFSVWIQDVDFSTAVDKTAKTPAPAQRLLKNHDWRAALDRFDAQGPDDPNVCPPVLGLTADGDGDWMRILPRRDGDFDICWECSLPGESAARLNLLGERKGVNIAMAARAIERLMAGDLNWLNENISERSSVQ